MIVFAAFYPLFLSPFFFTGFPGNVHECMTITNSFRTSKKRGNKRRESRHFVSTTILSTPLSLSLGVWLGQYYVTSVGVDRVTEDDLPTDSPPFPFETIVYAFLGSCKPSWGRPTITTPSQRAKPCQSTRNPLSA